ncbi:hypothetical protein INT45_014080 [Circinella minor]|uniref:Uncharacterized protein n=1 Tax=Circinella minor TaxID=1195481 RepID=A0A8H7S1T7_9FUNG|nr:hypothetical protein INT45_014080 [Circinella minor]
MDDATQYYVRQISGAGGNAFSRFRRDRLLPGENACCPQSEKTCNKGGNSDSVVSFWVSNIKGKYGDLTGYIISCPAGGYIQFKGVFEHPTFHVFDKDHNPFNAEIRHERGNMLSVNKKRTESLISHEKDKHHSNKEDRKEDEHKEKHELKEEQ